MEHAASDWILTGADGTGDAERATRGLLAAVADGSLQVEGEVGLLRTIAGAVDTFARTFPIVTP